MKTCTNHNLTGQVCQRKFGHPGAHKHISSIGVQTIWNWTPDRKLCNLQSRWLPIPPLWPKKGKKGKKK
jgi:hypothetical protein